MTNAPITRRGLFASLFGALFTAVLPKSQAAIGASYSERSIYKRLGATDGKKGEVIFRCIVDPPAAASANANAKTSAEEMRKLFARLLKEHEENTQKVIERIRLELSRRS